jgi:hypothetical protein
MPDSSAASARVLEASQRVLNNLAGEVDDCNQILNNYQIIIASLCEELYGVNRDSRELNYDGAFTDRVRSC